MKRKLKERSSTANMGLPVQKKTCQAGAQWLRKFNRTKNKVKPQRKRNHHTTTTN
jgi:hypothetical protein